MDSNVTASQSEPDHDNSSLQNPSTNPAEAGTTDETRDEDHETSSIEALNWSEVEEEELAAAQQAEALAAVAQGKLASEAKVSSKDEKSEEENGSSNNDEGSVLSTSLLQSINSTISDEDPQASKLSVIKNWASEVTDAVERGEIEMTEDFPEENGMTGDDDDDDEDEEENDNDNNGLRKRKGKKMSPDMISSMLSSGSNGESNIDPLSNAPVLDDGPIWNKGPRSYTFQENRRMNQKLTFCLLIAVVLAIGLGLGNLVAHQECEAEFKASQQSPQVKVPEKSPLHTVPTTTTPTPIIPDRSTDSSVAGAMPKKPVASFQMDDDDALNERLVISDKDDSFTTNKMEPVKAATPENLDERKERKVRKEDEPVIDPKYKVHAETVSNVVYTLDRLSREIDQFENTTRKLQGVLMIPEEEKVPETAKETPSLFEEEVHRDDIDYKAKDAIADIENDEDDMATVENLIDAIEQTPNYLEMKMHEKRLKELEKHRPESNLFKLDEEENNLERDSDIDIILKVAEQFKEFERRFVKSERKRLREAGKYERLSWRLPEEYSLEEKKALQVRYNSNWQEFIKLMKKKVPDPIETIFGAEEDEEERTFNELLYYPFPDPDADLTDDEGAELFMRNLEESLERLKDNPDSLEFHKDGKTDDKDVIQNSPVVSKLKEQQEDKPADLKDDDIIRIEERVEVSLPSEAQQVPPVIPSRSNEEEPVASDQNESKLKKVGDDTNFQGEKRLNFRRKRSEPTLFEHDDIQLKVEKKLNSFEGKREIHRKKIVRQDFAMPDQRKFKQPGSADSSKDWKREQKQKEKVYSQGKNNKKQGNNGHNNKLSVDSDKLRFNKEKSRLRGNEKKLKSLESNTIFENIEGKMVDKRRRGASPEKLHNGKYYESKKYHNGFNKKPTHEKPASEESTNTNPENYQSENDNTLKEHKSNHQKETVKPIIQKDNHKPNNPTNQKNDWQENGDMKYGTKEQKGKQHDRRNVKENHSANGKSDFKNVKKLEKPHKENKDFSYHGKETHYKQKEDFRSKQYNNRNNVPNSDNHQNEKRSKSFQSKEKTGRREKSRENSSSWGN